MRQSFDEHTDPSFGSQHLPLIRQAMAEQKLAGFVIPHEDEHQNEYLPEANDRLAWATGFTGSAGAAVILADKAAVVRTLDPCTLPRACKNPVEIEGATVTAAAPHPTSRA